MSTRDATMLNAKLDSPMKRRHWFFVIFHFLHFLVLISARQGMLLVVQLMQLAEAEVLAGDFADNLLWLS